MLGTIIIRELQEYIKSKKFLIGLLITIFLVAFSTVINIEDYQKRNSDYHTALQLRSTGIEKVYRPPQALGFFAQGKDKMFGTTVELTFGTINTFTTGYMGQMGGGDKRVNVSFSVVDLAFIIKVVLSLLVIFFAYNSISEEKANGTLKQTLSNQLPRDKMIFGKFISGLSVILIPLVLAFIISMLIAIAHPSISIGVSEWMRIFGMFCVSALYLAVIYVLSLLVSVLINRPSTALLILLQLWLFLIIIYPYTAVIVTNKFYSVSSEEVIFKRKNEPSEKYIELSEKIQEALKSSNRDQASQLSYERHVMIGNDLAVRNYQIDRELLNELKRQTKFFQIIASLSPAVLYDKSMMRLAKTGLTEFEKFIDGLLPHYMFLLESEFFSGRADLENLPLFNYSTEKNADSFLAIIFDGFLLFLFGIIFFALTYVSFLKKDVR